MPLLPIDNVGAGGIVSDFKPYQLQPNQWSSGRNVEFTDGSVSKIDGYREVMATCPIEPWHIGVYQDFEQSGKQARDGFYWIAFGMKKIYVYNKGEWFDITRESGEYNTNEGSDWKVTQSGALLVATNGVDIPQLWPLDSQNKVSVDNHFIDMPSWVEYNTPGETDLTCQALSGFKNHIIATNILRKFDGSALEEIQDRMVKWSTQHGHYTEPVTWDVIDDEQDAGEYELLDTPGPIVDTMPMGEVFMVYKTDSIYMMNYVGTPYIFSFKALDPDTGILAKGAVAEFPGGHFFVSFADCYVNNGQVVTPILTGKVRDEMFNNLNGDHYDRIFCVTQPHHNEIWACYPTAASEYCDRAMVWNYKENTFTFRDLPNITDAKLGVAAVRFSADQAVTWDDIDPDPSVPDVPWTSLTTMKWGTIQYDNVVTNLVMASPDSIKFFRDRAGQLEDTTVMYAFVERTGMDFGDPSAVKQLRAVWPKIETSGASIPMDVYTGYQMATDKPVTWEGPITFDPDTQSKVSVRSTGKFIGIRFESQSDSSWTISGIEFEFENVGRRGSRNYA